MALKLWFPDEIKPIIDSKYQAAIRDKTGDQLVGYVDALHDLATALGLPDPRVEQEQRPGVVFYDQDSETWVHVR